jgi:ribosomal protein S18 acetylase RimI-like enzyme
MDELQFRVATERDTDCVARIIHGSPGREAVGMMGGEEPARRFGFALTRLRARSGGCRRTLIAERAGRPVGVLQWRLGREPGLPMSWRLAWVTIRALGPVGAARAALRDRVRKRVNPPPPPDAFHIEELHVLESERGAGIGGRLLGHAEQLARARGFSRLSLITHTENPAQRLYRRAGFEEVERREDPDYRRLAGISGRLLMVKRLPAGRESVLSS